MKTTTYREAIQSYIEIVEKLYDIAGGLRDHADTGTEKSFWNSARQQTRDLSDNMRRLDNLLPAAQASMSLEDWKFPIVIVKPRYHGQE
jgi:hypothetical protein